MGFVSYQEDNEEARWENSLRTVCCINFAGKTTQKASARKSSSLKFTHNVVRHAPWSLPDNLRRRIKLQQLENNRLQKIVYKREEKVASKKSPGGKETSLKEMDVNKKLSQVELKRSKALLRVAWSAR